MDRVGQRRRAGMRDRWGFFTGPSSRVERKVPKDPKGRTEQHGPQTTVAELETQWFSGHPASAAGHGHAKQVTGM